MAGAGSIWRDPDATPAAYDEDEPTGGAVADDEWEWPEYLEVEQ